MGKGFVEHPIQGETSMVPKQRAGRLSKALCGVLLVLAWEAGAAGTASFPTPEAAVQALIASLKAEDPEALKSVMGPEVTELESGDPVADAAAITRFLEEAEKGTSIEPAGDDRALLLLGPEGWPFSIPLVREDEGWRFDTEAGKEELLNRRIGANELHAIATIRACVEAQHEYASRDPTGEGVRQYAQRLGSGEGKRDGLYWVPDEGEPESPLGPLVARAVEEGYTGSKDAGASPYHGYFFRILNAQGENAPGGALSYLADGRMTRGFAFLAYPAEYGKSGIMTFIANQRGVVYEKDLGGETGELAEAITRYDPDKTWSPVADD
jgi:hypothetical protein